MIAEPDEWRARDVEFAAARQACNDAVRAWREAGEYHPVGGAPSHRDLCSEVKLARTRRNVLGREAMPSDPDALISAMTAGDAKSIEDGLKWLETDPFSWNSGYLKQRVMTRLGQVVLSQEQQDRLRALLVTLTTRGPRMEFREACRLATRVDSDELRRRLMKLSTSTDARSAAAASRMLQACESKGKHSGTG